MTRQIPVNAKGLTSYRFSLPVLLLVLIIWGQTVFAMEIDFGLISAEILNQQIEHWMVLDGRPTDQYMAGHIRGAHPFSWENYTRTDEKGVPYRLLPVRELTDLLGLMGIDRNTPVAVYGDGKTSWGGEGWLCWVLSYMGHAGPVRLLDGGIQAWQEKSMPMENGLKKHEAKNAEYKSAVRDGLRITAEQIHKHPDRYQLVDTRSLTEWVKGRLPDAVHIQWKDFYHGPHHAPIARQDLKNLLVDHNIDPAKPTVYYCTGGIRSGYAWAVHQLAGLPPAINFEGGTEEWERCQAFPCR